jgi:membrane protease YdiL (CAAX protease family)
VRLGKRADALAICLPVRLLLSFAIPIFPLAVAVALTSAVLFATERVSITSLGLALDPRLMTYAAWGASVAVGSVALTYLIALFGDFVHVTRSRLTRDCLPTLPLFLDGLTTFFSFSIVEEIIFRGYVYRELCEAWNGPVAIVVSSIIFSLAHLTRRHRNSPMYLLNAFLFALMAGAARYYTGTLWLPIGLHIGWNVISGPILGLPCAGRDYENGVLLSRVSGPLWLTGGILSLDAGLLGTFSILVAVVGLVATAPII